MGSTDANVLLRESGIDPGWLSAGGMIDHELHYSSRRAFYTAAAVPGDLGHGRDDVYLVAQASTKGFVGCNASVGVSRRIWAAFIGDVKKLETTRVGEARLISMSPADFELRVRSYDRARHICITGFVGDYMILRDVTDVPRVPFRIEIDPSTLASLVIASEQLVVSRE